MMLNLTQYFIWLNSFVFIFLQLLIFVFVLVMLQEIDLFYELTLFLHLFLYHIFLLDNSDQIHPHILKVPFLHFYTCYGLLFNVRP